MTPAPDALNFLDLVSVAGLPFALVALAGTWFLVRMEGRFAAELGRRFASRRLVVNQYATLLAFGTWLAGAGFAFTLAVRLTDEIMFALAGTIAVTVGFALKDLAASVLAGVILLFDRPFQVGDRVTFGSVYGEIAAIGLRSVRLITLDDSVVTIPNNLFLTSVVISGNSGALDMMIVMDFHVGVDQDVALAKRLVGEALTASRYVYPEKPWSVLVAQCMLGDSLAVRLRAKAYTLDVTFEKLFETDVTERVLGAFATHGIGPPAVLHRSLPARPSDEPAG